MKSTYFIAFTALVTGYSNAGEPHPRLATANKFLERPCRLEELDEGFHSDIDLDAEYSDSGYTLMHWAARAGDNTTIDWLYQHNANIDYPSPNAGLTPAHVAAMNGHPDTMHHLAQLGADMTVEDHCRKTSDEWYLELHPSNEGRVCHILVTLATGTILFSYWSLNS